MFWYPKLEDYDIRDNQGLTLREFLDRYDPKKYVLPAVTVDNLIFQQTDKGYKILLIRRGRHPSFGMLALPGGFIEMNEALETSAKRELMEETGLIDIPLVQLGAYGEINRDPRLRIISVAYIGIITKEVETTAGDDADEAQFFSISMCKNRNNLETRYELCFENENHKAYATIVETAGKREILNSNIASDHSIMILDALERLGSFDNM
jgi:8-oxo-dGTP diphosphatase